MRNRLRKLVCTHHVLIHEHAGSRRCAACGTRV
jgi:hypothetical protein